MIKLIYFDFNFWRIDILRLSLLMQKFHTIMKELSDLIGLKKKNFPFGQLQLLK